MVVRGGRGAGLAFVVLWCASVAGAAPRELRAITLRPASDGTTVVIAVSPPATPHVAIVRGEDGGVRRIHVDLPHGTTIRAGAAPSGPEVLPVVRVRAGMADDDHARVVIETDDALDYRLEPSGDRGTIVLTVIGNTNPSKTASASERPPPAAAAATARAMPRRRDRPKIVLDPGHGGDDPGAQGYAIEKEVTLDLAHRLARLLRTRLGADVVLTRTGDRTLALKERTALANTEGADLFVSIHANANTTGQLRGIETYYLDNSTDHATLRLATLENGLDLLRPTNEASLRYILSDLVQVGKLDDSVRLARSVQRGLVGHLRGSYPGVVDLGVKRGPFYVLVGAYMPCVLVESAFLTHPVEGRRLARAEYRADVAEGLYRGIARFLADVSRRRTL